MAEIYRSDIVRVDLDHALLRKHVGAIIVTGDKLGNRFGAEIFRDGKPVDVTDCGVTAYFMRPGEDAIVLNGTASGSVAYVDLAQACYSKASSFTLTIKISYSGATTALRVIDGYILLTQTDDLVDPGDVVPTLDDIFAQIAAMEAAKNNANAAATNAVNIATEKGDQAIQLAQEEADKQNVKIAALTQEINTKVVAGIGPFVTSDSLPVIEDADTATPNRITAIAKSNYVENMPGTGPDSQGTLLHFAHATNTAANCQVQMLVTPERKVWVRNLWSTDDGWRSWVQLETKVTFYVGGGDKATHTRLLDAINDANALPDHIHVDIMVCQSVNLYEELGGADYVASFTDATNPNAGPTLRTNVDLIGVGMPSIRLECPDDVATYNFTYSVSPLNLKGTNKLSGIVFVGKNTRYVIHDEGGGHGDYNRIVENCYFYHNGTFEGGWYSGQAYGAGTGHSGAYLFDGCVFESPKMPFSIHNNSNVVRPIIKFVNCVFKGGAGHPGARFGTYGSGYVQGNVYINGCRSSGVIRTVTEGDYDTFNDAGFQIVSGDTVYRTDLAKLTYYAGNDVWKEI